MIAPNESEEPKERRPGWIAYDSDVTAQWTPLPPESSILGVVATITRAVILHRLIHSSSACGDLVYNMVGELTGNRPIETPSSRGQMS